MASRRAKRAKLMRSDWFGMVWWAWDGVRWFVLAWLGFGLLWFVLVCLGVTQFDLVCPWFALGLPWFGLVGWLGFGLPWFGCDLPWFDLVWLGLASARAPRWRQVWQR